MATVTKIPLSGSTHGRGILITGTAVTGGTTIHTANSVTGDGYGDEVALYAQNLGTTDTVLSVGFGGTTSGDTFKRELPPNALLPIAPGFIIRNSLAIKVAAGTANKVTVFGHVIRRVS